MTKKQPIEYWGIDPGWVANPDKVTGAIAFLGPDGSIADMMPIMMPDLKGLTEFAMWAQKNPNIHVTIEDPPGNPVWSIQTNKALFEHLGQLKALFPNAHYVDPRIWQPAMWTPESWEAVPRAKNTSKKRSLYVARKHWPSARFTPEDNPGKPKDGIVDACLIALYGLMTRRGKFHS